MYLVKFNKYFIQKNHYYIHTLKKTLFIFSSFFFYISQLLLLNKLLGVYIIFLTKLFLHMKINFFTEKINNAFIYVILIALQYVIFVV